MGNPDYIIDIEGLKPGNAGKSSASRARQGVDGQGGRTLRGRPWIAVHWKCCGVYNRIYRDMEGTAYEGRCPKCGRSTRARVGPDGMSARFFETK